MRGFIPFSKRTVPLLVFLLILNGAGISLNVPAYKLPDNIALFLQLGDFFIKLRLVGEFFDNHGIVLKQPFLFLEDLIERFDKSLPYVIFGKMWRRAMSALPVLALHCQTVRRYLLLECHTLEP